MVSNIRYVALGTLVEIILMAPFFPVLGAEAVSELEMPFNDGISESCVSIGIDRICAQSDESNGNRRVHDAKFSSSLSLSSAEEKPSFVAGNISNIAEKEKTSHPKLEQVLYELAKSNDPEAFAQEKGIAMTDGKVRVIIMLSNDGNVSGKFNLIIEEKDKNLIQALVPVDAIIDIAEDSNVNFIKIPDVYIPAKEDAETPKQADYPLPWAVLISIIFLIGIRGGKKI